jgi:5-formyltetrahydrofolate cyclo-ligase
MRERKAGERVDARARRKAIPMPVRRAKEQRIRDLVHELPEMKRANIVGCYVGVHSEVDTRVLIEELLSQEVRVAVPVVLPPERMTLAEIESLGDLKPGAHRIPEPPAEARSLVEDVDALLIPGLLFTRDGHRLGNGGGYYDRLLRDMPRASRIGLAYAEQVVAELPVELHDERMDIVVSDGGVHRAKPRAPTNGRTPTNG